MIDFSHDRKVTRSLLHFRSKEHFPTQLNSAQLRQVGREIKERSFFSAENTNAECIQKFADIIDRTLSGEIGMAKARLLCMRALKQIGYDPATGFPQDMAGIAPAERGSIRDLSSERRIDLMLRTNVAMARNYGRVVSGNTPAALFQFPAWELVRVGQRRVERGSPDSHSEGWRLRWIDAGRSVSWEGAIEEEMIALKSSPIWQSLGDGFGGYEDTLGNPYPPFAFNSGMDWRAVPRIECVQHGLVASRGGSDPMNASLAPTSKELQARFDNLSPDIKAALERRWAQ